MIWSINNAMSASHSSVKLVSSLMEARLATIILIVVAGSVLVAARGEGQCGPAASMVCPIDSLRRLPMQLSVVRSQARVRASSRGAAVTWDVYNSDPALYAGREVRLKQDDFEQGTVRLTRPGVYVLDEDISFAPAADNDFRPDRSNPLYAGPAYVLGFFAAITVECDGVVLDLNGHTIAQAPIHALQQRFFAVIELGQAPFVFSQGPANFGSEFGAATNVFIENGTIGRSSHHGIHGNAGRNAFLRNLKFVDYEVAAIALNGFKDVVIEDVHALGQFTNVPVLGTYSNARFTKQFVDSIVASADVPTGSKNDLTAKMARLQTLMDEAAADIVASGNIDSDAHPEAYALFHSPTGLTDGNSYAVVIHSRGVAVGAFGQTPPEENDPLAAERIIIRNSVFEKTNAHIVEVIAMTAHGKIVRGPAGDVLRVMDNSGSPNLFDAAGTYVGTALSDVQFSIAAAMMATPEASRGRLFGTTFASDDVLSWANGNLKLGEVGEVGYLRNGDSMFHTNKGVVGLRIDRALGVCLDNVSIDGVSNSGERGITADLPGEAPGTGPYISGEDGGHPDQGSQYGYMGSDTRGVSIAASKQVFISNTRVNNVHSRYGFARGIDIFNHASGVEFIGSNNHVTKVRTLTEDSDAVMQGTYTNGPRVGAAVGVNLSAASCPMTERWTSVKVDDVLSGVFDQSHRFTVDATIEPSDVNSVHPNTYEL